MKREKTPERMRNQSLPRPAQFIQCTSDKLDKALKLLKDLQIDAYSIEMDVRSEPSIMNSVHWVEKHWGKINLILRIITSSCYFNQRGLS